MKMFNYHFFQTHTPSVKMKKKTKQNTHTHTGVIKSSLLHRIVQSNKSTTGSACAMCNVQYKQGVMAL